VASCHRDCGTLTQRRETRQRRDRALNQLCWLRCAVCAKCAVANALPNLPATKGEVMKLRIPSKYRRIKISPAAYRARFRYNVCKRILYALERDYENNIHEYCVILDEDEIQELIKIMTAIVKEGE
jgi:hypothetical protein